MQEELGDFLHEDKPPYFARLGLLSEPFADVDTGHFYYAGAEGQQRLDLLLHLAPYSVLLLVVGEPGVGKTALMRQFVVRANETWRIAALTARRDSDRDEIMTEMSEALGLPLQSQVDPQAQYAALIAQLRALSQTAQVPILLIDDAQYLSKELMELILKLCVENDGGHVLSVILIGSPPLQTLLENPALAPLAARVTHIFEMNPFSEQETGRYIRHRLRAAGAGDDGPFDSMMINKIHAASGGIPARINELAQRVLLDRNLDGKERQTGAGNAAMRGTQMRRSLAMVAGAVVIALLLAGPLRSILFKPAPLAPAVPRQAESLSPPANNGGEEPRVIRLEESAAVPAPAPSPEADTATSATSATQDVKPLPLPPISPASEAPAVVMEPARPAAAPVPQAEVPAVASPVKESTKPEDLKPQATKPKAPASQALGNGIRGEEWVRAQPAGQFTLQLMALKEEKAARQFIETHHLQDNSAYYPIQRNGQILYALVYGVYPSQGEALQAAKDLPASWRVSNPWVRSFKSLRGEINP